jgi:hypothetical protein
MLISKKIPDKKFCTWDIICDYNLEIKILVHTLLRIILSSNSAVLINIITGVSPPHFDFFVFYVLCQC